MPRELDSKVLIEADKERLAAAQQAVDLAHSALSELSKADNLLLAENASDMVEEIVKIDQKLRRLIEMT